MSSSLPFPPMLLDATWDPKAYRPWAPYSMGLMAFFGGPWTVWMATGWNVRKLVPTSGLALKTHLVCLLGVVVWFAVVALGLDAIGFEATRVAKRELRWGLKAVALATWGLVTLVQRQAHARTVFFSDHDGDDLHGKALLPGLALCGVGWALDTFSVGMVITVLSDGTLPGADGG